MGKEGEGKQMSWWLVNLEIVSLGSGKGYCFGVFNPQNNS
jgi:hypothetical protein